MPENDGKDRAKEVFHTESFKSVHINILKDGTVEFRNKGAEFSTTFMGGLTLDDSAMRHAESDHPSSHGGSMNGELVNGGFGTDGYVNGVV